MALAKEVYQALEDIVGPENITEEPAMLDSYAFQRGAELVGRPGRFMPRAEAVILPGSTKEVQAIVKTCNRHRLKYKAYSTGWSTYSIPDIEGVILMDLRRMDKILEIDEQNMFAVVEPYVISATLQAEAMKVGLNCHIIGAGACCSPLATATSFLGSGPSGMFMGLSSDNLLGLEWVMPTGEILRTGSLGSGAGWFCGDGPGPSVRGLCRGFTGACGGMGVYTRCAIRLHPWPGPPVMPVEGITPAYNSPLPDNIRSYTLAFPTWQAYADAYHKIFDAELGYIFHRQFNFFGEDLQAAMIKIISDPDKQLDDLESMLEKPEIQKLNEALKHSFQIVLAGNTTRDIEYQEKALAEILTETDGVNVSEMADPDMQKYTLLYMIKLCYKNMNFIYAGGYNTCLTYKGTPDFAISYVPIAEDLLRKHQQTGLVADTGADAMMGGATHIGGGGVPWFEQFMFFDPHDEESRKAGRKVLIDVKNFSAESKWPGTLEGSTGSREEKERVMTSSNQPDMYRWQGKIKKMLDPNDTSDGSYPYLE